MCLGRLRSEPGAEPGNRPAVWRRPSPSGATAASEGRSTRMDDAAEPRVSRSLGSEWAAPWPTADSLRLRQRWPGLHRSHSSRRSVRRVSAFGTGGAHPHQHWRSRAPTKASVHGAHPHHPWSQPRPIFTQRESQYARVQRHSVERLFCQLTNK